MNGKLKQAINLRSQKEYHTAEILFKELCQEFPNNADVFYNYAWLCDNMGRELEALPKYEQALSLGINGEDLKSCYLGLGSTYRNVGEYEKSIALFNKAISEFPSSKEYQVFIAMALYNINKHKEAMNLLLNVIADTSSNKGVQTYKNAIRFYSKTLDKKSMR